MKYFIDTATNEINSVQGGNYTPLQTEVEITQKQAEQKKDYSKPVLRSDGSFKSWIDDEALKLRFDQSVKNNKMIEWGITLKNHVTQPEVWFALPKNYRDDLTDLFLYVKEFGVFPDIQLLAKANPELFSFIESLIADESVNVSSPSV